METYGSAITYQSPITPPICPHCGHGYQVERIASVVAQRLNPPADQFFWNTARSQPPLRPLGGDRSGIGLFMRPYLGRGLHASVVASDPFLPPEAPLGVGSRIVRRVATIVVFVLLSLALLVAVRNPSMTADIIGRAVPRIPLAVGALLTGFVAVVCMVWLVGILISHRLQQRVRKEIAAYGRAMQRWNGLYYCADCKCIFAPGMDHCITPRRIHNYLYQERA